MTKKTSAKAKLDKALGRSPSVSKTLIKRVFYFALVAIPVILAFKNKKAVVTAASIAYDHLADAGEVIATQTENLIEKVKDMDLV